MNAKEFLKELGIENKFVQLPRKDPSKGSAIMIYNLMEDYHKYKSKPKGKTLEERKDKFIIDVWIDVESHFNKLFSYNNVSDFLDYWTEHGENDKKMRFEKEKSFGIKRRLATWKKNSKKWDTNKPVSLADKLKQDHGLQ